MSAFAYDGIVFVEGVRTPSLVAKAVMDYTDHVMLVGEGARKFALAMGFQPQNLLTERSRQDWLRWKSRLNPRDHWVDHDDDVRIKFTTGTINMNAVNATGDLSSVTTTSGMAWKIPGRIGDSPVLGAGLYVDGEVGAAGSTGRGEANLYNLSSFLIVEGLRRRISPAAVPSLQARSSAPTGPRTPRPAPAAATRSNRRGSAHR